MTRSLCLAALGAAFLAGCNKSPEGGPAPGTDNSFSLSLPSNTPPTTIKQKDKQTVSVEVSRGKEFKQTVTLKVEAPAGLKVELDKTKVGPNDPNPGKVNMTIEADDKAPVGEHKVIVTGTPESGSATSKDFTVKVENRGG